MATLKISNTVTLDENEVEISAIKAQGSGGQKVNKVSAAIHLRFDVSAPLLSLSFTKSGYSHVKTSVLPKTALLS